MKIRAATYLAMAVLAWAVTAHAAPTTKASLVVGAETARPGQAALAGVRLQMAPNWHTYWRYGGDAGAPTTIEWELPKGITAGPIQWPVPEKYSAEGLYSYVYHEEVVLITPLQLAKDLAPGPVKLKAKVSWLECEQLCLPGEATVEATLKVGAETRASADAALLEQWQKAIPPIATNLPVRASWEAETKEGRGLILEWKAGPGFSEPEFFPIPTDSYDIGGETKVLASEAGTLKIRKPAKKFKGDWPEQIRGVLTAKNADGTTAAYEVVLPLGGAKPITSAAKPAPFSLLTLLLKLGGAFIGGLILNIMPCVLPVIALKILGFVNQSREEPKRIRKLGLIYAAGVLCSFLVLASVVIGVKQAGQAASWGFQFQNAQFVVLMTVLVLLVSLNLFGVFEITLGSGAMTAASSLASRQGSGGAFFNGVLATVLATPCTAPFLGAAMGFAMAPEQTAPVILLFFLTVGAGLAFPYVVLSWKPAWLKFIPKPGPWMDRFKKAMGFPMLATAVWLYSLCLEAFGLGSDLWMGVFLVLLALAAWIWGEFVQRGNRGRGAAMAIAIGLLIFSYAYVLEARLQWRSPPQPTKAEGIIKTHPDGIEWRAWSPEAVAEARAQGRPILVDFTASWCWTCQLNAKTSIEIPSVKQKLKEINAVALIENSRVKNAEVVAELNRHGRAGVPLVLVYPKNPDAPAEVLPEVLTPSIMLNALDRAAQ